MSFAFNSQAEFRKKAYKMCLHTDKARQKRHENVVKIRKSERKDNFLKRRRKKGLSHHNIDQELLPTILWSLPSLIEGMWSDNANMQLNVTIQMRKLFLNHGNPNVGQVINSGVVPRLVRFLTRHDFPQLQFQAAWALTNIACETAQVVIDDGAVPILVHLLKHSPIDDVREQSIWALGNVARYSLAFRDLVLRHGALKPLLSQLNQHATMSMSMLRTATWVLAGFLRGEPQLHKEDAKSTLETLQWLIHLPDEEVVTDACHALSYLTAGSNEKIYAVIEAGVCPRLVELLRHPASSVVYASLCTLGKIVAGDDVHTQFVIDIHVLPNILALLTSNSMKSIKKKACWTISNITAGTREQIQAVIDANIFPAVVKLIESAEFDVKKEAAWVVSNAIVGGSRQHIKYSVDVGCTKALCDLLDCSDPMTLRVCLEALDFILHVGELEKELASGAGLELGRGAGMNIYAQYVKDIGGLDKMLNLLGHHNNEIHQIADIMIRDYWVHDFEDY